MKTGYFTSDNLSEKAQQFLEALPSKRRLGSSGFDPDSTAFIILDMQKYFLDQSSHAFVPSAAAVLPGILKLAAAFNKRRRPVVLTRHLNTPQNSGEMAHWWADLIRTEDPASQLIPELERIEALRIQKSQYDAFYGTELETELKQMGVSQVVVAGVLTHLCCETTARGAFMRGFKVFFLVDGTATYCEDFHRATLLNLSHGFAVPVGIDHMTRIMES
jgi:nicotinamidase-related amidase